MEHRLQRWIFLVLTLLWAFNRIQAQGWEVRATETISGWHVHGVSRTLVYSAPICSVGIPVSMGIYALIKKDEPLLKNAIYIGTSVIEAVGITKGLKEICDRRRPFVKYPDRIYPHNPPASDSPSFPSTHAAAAFSLATSVSISYPKWYVIVPSAVWACGVGFARINQGVHYPTDVLAGAAVGTGCAFLNIYINRWLNKWLFH